MYSDTCKNWIRYRFALIGYAGCSVIYWDLKQDMIVNSERYTYWIWVQDYYFGISIAPFSMYIVYNHMMTSGDKLVDVGGGDDVASSKTSAYKNLAISFLGGCTALIVFSALIVSILKESRREITQFYRACFLLDGRVKDSFKEDGTSDKLLQTAYKSSKDYELVVIFTCLLSAVVPIILMATVYHPADPVRNILEEILEIEVSPSFQVLFLSSITSWSVFAMTNTFISFLIPGILTISSSFTWISSMMPKAPINRVLFETKMLGKQHFDKILWVYRCHQILCMYLNAIIAKRRIALHFAILHVMFVVSAFILIRNFDLFLENGSYELIFIFGSMCIGSVGICKVECLFIGNLVQKSRDVRGFFHAKCRRGQYAYKASKSLQDLVVRSAYPFFTVNDETFLEFMNISVDHIVSLLCF